MKISKSVSPRKNPSRRKQSHGYPTTKKDQHELVMKNLKTYLQPHHEGVPDSVRCNDCGAFHSVEVSRANNSTFGDVYRKPRRDCPNKQRTRVSPHKLAHLRHLSPFNSLLHMREMLETPDNPRTPADQIVANATPSQSSSSTASPAISPFRDVPASSSVTKSTPAMLAAADSPPATIKQQDDLRDFFNPGPIPTDTPIRNLVVRTPVQRKCFTGIPVVTPSSPTKRACDDDDRGSLSPIERVRKDDDDEDDKKLWEEVEREFPFNIPLLSNEALAKAAVDKKAMDIDFPLDVYLFTSDGQPRIELVHRRANKQLALEDVSILAPHRVVQRVDEAGKTFPRPSLTLSDFTSVIKPYVIFKLPIVSPVVVRLWWAQNKESLKEQYEAEYERYT